MKTFTVCGTDDIDTGGINDEADSLCKAIESHYAALWKAELGRKAVLSDARFRLLQADRNTVYRVRRRFRWYLKIPR